MPALYTYSKKVNMYHCPLCINILKVHMYQCPLWAISAHIWPHQLKESCSTDAAGTAQWSRRLDLHILRMFEGIFSFDTDLLIEYNEVKRNGWDLFLSCHAVFSLIIINREMFVNVFYSKPWSYIFKKSFKDFFSQKVVQGFCFNFETSYRK